MKVNFGIKISAMLSSLVLGLICFVGCNSDEPTPATGTGPAAGKPADTAKPTTPPVKTDEKK